MNHNNSFDRNFFNLNEKNGSSFVIAFSKKKKNILTSISVFIPNKLPFICDFYQLISGLSYLWEHRCEHCSILGNYTEELGKNTEMQKRNL